MNILADFIHSQADTLRDAWATLLKDTVCEQWEQRQNEAGITGVPMNKSEVQSFTSIHQSGKASPVSTDDRLEKLERFFKELADLTIHYEVIAGAAVVFPSALGEALNRVDSDWFLHPGRGMETGPW